MVASYPCAEEQATRAARRHGLSPETRAFFKAFAMALENERSQKRQAGDRHGLEACLRVAMDGLIDQIIRNHPGVTRPRLCAEIPGLRHGKRPDFALQKGSRVYVIEQKSMLEFNSFGAVLLEALVFKRQFGAELRFGAFFHYLKQRRQAFDELSHVHGMKIVDHMCLLIPTIGSATYDPSAVQAIYDDMISWLIVPAKRSNG